MSHIYVFVTRVGTSWVIHKCPICGRKHYHGAPPEDVIPGSRAPHCAPRYGRFGKVVWEPPRDVHFELTTNPALDGKEVPVDT